MLKKLRADYEKFKSKPLSEQVLRVSNTMFATFTFWNLVFRPDQQVTLASTPHPVVMILSLFCGLIFGALLFIKLPRYYHLCILPLVAASFALSSHRSLLLSLVSVPASVIGILLLVRLIISVANYINRI